MTKNVCTIFIVINHISDLTTLNDISNFQKWQAFFPYYRANRTNRAAALPPLFQTASPC